MSRLKHPIRALREPFGKAGLTVAIAALVFALAGAAYAAGGLTKSQEKQVTKIAKKYAGKPGAPGAAGTPGTNGTAGANGKNGTPGKEGPKGEEGSPWTAGGTLPEGKTETGVWGFAAHEVGSIIEHFSFPIPLEARLEEENIHIIKPGEEGKEFAAECPGTLFKPQAAEGNLCIYSFELAVPFIAGDTTVSLASGVDLFLLSTEASPGGGGKVDAGTWAVTAE